MEQKRKAGNDDKTVKVEQKGYSDGENREFGHRVASNDVEVRQTGLVLMNKGWISHEGLCSSVKSGATKSGVMQHCLPN